MLKHWWIVLVVVGWSVSVVRGQVVVGTVVDSTAGSPILGATVILHRLPENEVVAGAVTNREGKFALRVTEGMYLLQIRSLGYDTLVRRLRVRGSDTLALGVLRLRSSSVIARDVVVEETAPRVEVKGDTLEYNASQFKTERNADADKLVAKLPGVEVEGGQVRAQGQTVQQVLVDGKPFFGRDPLSTLRALPAEIIERVQVYDQMSDQAQFTRFDDGERIKTINLVTRADRRQGQFGKLYAGYGENTRYTAGANVNHWGGDQRLSFMGMSNNINQQNFAIEDILGMFGGGGNPLMRMMGSAFSAMRQSMRGGRFGGDGGPGFLSNFLVTPTDGITQSHAAALNYSNEFGKWLDLSASYFLNASTNDAEQSLERQLFLGDTLSQWNTQRTDATTRNLNHRFNLRADITLDSMNSILVTPRLTWQSTDRTATGITTTRTTTQPLNQLATQTATVGHGMNANTELLYRRRFETEGRTFSARLQWNEQSNTTDPTTNAVNTFYDGATRYDTLKTMQPQDGSNRTLSANLLYTEPLAERHQLQVGYILTRNQTQYERSWTQPVGADSYTGNWYTAGDAFTHRPGVRYKLIAGSPDTSGATRLFEGIMRAMAPRGMGRMMQQSGVGIWNIELGADYQYVSFDVRQSSTEHIGQQSLNDSFTLRRSFHNVLPTFSISTRPTLMSFFRLWYAAQTNLPTPAQLQEALDNTNPLQLSIGNGRLSQELTHSLWLTYATFELQTASSFFISLNASMTQQRIATTTTVAARDTTIFLPLVRGQRPIFLPAGTQLQQPTNLDGYWNATAFVLYSRPVAVWGVKLNVSGSVALTYLRDPSIINGAENIAQTRIVTPGLSITSNISENLDFTVSGRVAWNTVENTLRQQLNQRFTTQTLLARATYITTDSSALLDGWVFNTEFNYVATNGLAEGYNLAVPLLNIGIGKRFFDGRAELRLSVFDVLGRNNSINRTVGSGYVEDTQTTVLRRYALLSLTYFLRAFKGS
ncbi:MAG: outer membrane beta-barrel protein [Candidatus Kapabacteria bacterium]|nr:outer membrane beta-barrel protein [Candidatus Kapabacteria bacterium]